MTAPTADNDIITCTSCGTWLGHELADLASAYLADGGALCGDCALDYIHVMAARLARRHPDGGLR